MDDLISRQATIEIIRSMYPGMPRVSWMLKKWQKQYEPYIRLEEEIKELPSAQPEIIHCKDCCHYPGEHTDCPLIGWGRNENDFCSWAERRTDEQYDRKTGCD